VRRGEIWRYVSKGLSRERFVVVLSTDAINDAPDQDWFLGVEIVPDDPGHLLAVEVTGHGWVTPQHLDALYRRSCVDEVGTVDADTLRRISSMLQIALDV
jgi:mRNA-degrading endonuclease toxin of MazEF toxin-antitoxin module